MPDISGKEDIEAAARAIADAWGETWECCCTEQRGLDCDCGDAMPNEREEYEDRLSREDCRMAARAALEATALVRAKADAWEPVAHAYVIDGECEQIEWGTDADLPDDHALVWLYAHPAPTAGGDDD